MSKLHEILAVEGSAQAAANKLLEESKKTLGKDSLFNGIVRELEMFRAEDKKSETKDYQELTTTVDENLDYLVKPVAEWVDIVATKDTANREAKADIIVDGRTLAFEVPATTLLGLESKLAKIREVYMAIPTLEPGIKWIKDETDKDNVFRTEHSTVQMKSIKDPEFRVVVAATENHPAQVERVDRTLDVGRYITTRYSGKMTPLEKAQRLERIDSLVKAVKAARMRANNVDVKKVSIGKALLDFINYG